MSETDRATHQDGRGLGRREARSPAAPAPAAKTRWARDIDAAIGPDSDAQASGGQSEDSQLRRAEGWLMPVHSTKRVAPPFAVLDDDGRVQSLRDTRTRTQPAAIRQTVCGLAGRPALRRCPAAPHITAERVVKQRETDDRRTAVQHHREAWFVSLERSAPLLQLLTNSSSGSAVSISSKRRQQAGILSCHHHRDGRDCARRDPDPAQPDQPATGGVGQTRGNLHQLPARGHVRRWPTCVPGRDPACGSRAAWRIAPAAACGLGSWPCKVGNQLAIRTSRRSWRRGRHLRRTVVESASGCLSIDSPGCTRRADAGP